jgi:hypothetical protein
MEDQLRACVNGPLAEHADGFRAELLSQGYTRDAVSCQLRLMAGVSGWLSVSGMEPSELASTALMDEFLKARRAEGCKRLLSRRAMMPLIAYLARVNVAPAALVVTGSPTDVLIEEYRRYLVDERGLSKSTVAWYLDAARLFLSECGHLDDGRTGDRLRRRAVPPATYRRSQGARHEARSLLRFLFVSGATSHQLAGVVTTPSGYSGGSLPRCLDDEAIAALLRDCDRKRAIGRRDFAILTIRSSMARSRSTRSGPTRHFAAHSSPSRRHRASSSPNGAPALPAPRSSRPFPAWRERPG